MKSFLKAGMTVFHRWSSPYERPIGISETALKLYNMDTLGILLDIEYEHPYLSSKIPYWNVIVDGSISQWRADMIKLAS